VRFIDQSVERNGTERTRESAGWAQPARLRFVEPPGADQSQRFELRTEIALVLEGAAGRTDADGKLPGKS